MRCGLISVAIPCLLFIDPLLRVDYGNGGHVHDILNVRALLQYMHGKIHTQQDRSDFRCATEVMKQLLCDMSGAQVRKYQYVRPLLEDAEGIRRSEDVLVHRRIALHLAVDDQSGIALPQNRDCLRHLLRLRMTHRSEVGERQHRNLRRYAKIANDPSGGVGDLRQLLRCWIDVDGGVSTEDNVLLEDQHVEAADYLRLRMRPDDLESGADRLGGVHADAGQQRVRIATGDHHRAEVVAVEQQLMRLAVAQSLSLAALPEIISVFIALFGF